MSLTAPDILRVYATAGRQIIGPDEARGIARALDERNQYAAQLDDLARQVERVRQRLLVQLINVFLLGAICGGGAVWLVVLAFSGGR